MGRNIQMTDAGSPITAPRHAHRRKFAASLAAGAAAAALILAGVAAPAASAAPRPASPHPGPGAAATPSAWAIQPTPNPLVRDGGLASVSCTSASACIAVGQRMDLAGDQVTLAERWNGTAWSVLKMPNPPGTRGITLAGVSCASPSFCMAVGNTVTATANPTLTEVWNGSTWSIQLTPDAPGAQFTGAARTSPPARRLVGSVGS